MSGFPPCLTALQPAPSPQQALGDQTRDDALAAARTELGADFVTAIWDAGRALPADQAVARALALRPGAPHSRPVTAATVQTSPAGVHFDLSVRERKIVALPAQRLTDMEIADSLFISPSTVMTHATNILNKLGVANRREAAAVAVRHGLV